ncbi:hypothetical protein ACFVYD_11710 [Streptomyces sp. NPDC058301]|uniref:hypothetical protein n=1 Tax=Streptomyces sp. NPDC058301 TaxID=3346436 RepID=UPI0036E30691
MIDLHDPAVARSVLEALRRKRDGDMAAPETVRRKRKVLVHALHDAIEQGELGTHPLERIRWRVPKQSVAVFPRVVVNPQQAQNLVPHQATFALSTGVTPSRVEQQVMRDDATRPRIAM